MPNNNNTRNPESSLFQKLTRLLSGPIVNRRTQTYRQQRRRDLDKYKFRSAQGLNFKKSVHNPLLKYNQESFSNQNRAERYSDFDQMEYVPEIASALDIYADEMTTHTTLEDMLKVNCENEEIRSILKNLYHNVINVEFNLFGWCRSMCKFGDYFLYLDVDETDGVKSVVGLPSHEVERLEGEDQTNPNYVQFQWNSGGLTFENWQVAHFRILGNDKYSPYGSSILEPARRIWRQLTLLEDAMMAYRIVRSPERRVFYIDVGNIAPQDVEQYMQKVITSMKRNQVVDTNTGRVDLRYNPLSVEEDYFLPVRGDATSKIESLPGGTFTGDIDDVKYLRDKLFSALKIPQSYLSRDENSGEDKTTLAQKDVRFARTIQRLQRSVVSELEKIGIIHLFTLGFRGEDLLGFTLSLNNPSKIAELQELEHWRTKFDVAAQAGEGFFSKRWIATKLFGLTDDEIVRLQRENFHDKKFEAALASVAEGEAGEGFQAGAGGGLGDDDLGGDDAPSLDDLAGDTGGDDTPPPAGGDDSMLITSPDNPAPEAGGDEPVAEQDTDGIVPGQKYTRPGWKGKKHKSNPRGKKNAARQKSMLAAPSGEKASSSIRNTLPGLQNLYSLGSGITESKDTTYKKQEQVLFGSAAEVKTLISSLMEKDKDEQEA